MLNHFVCAAVYTVFNYFIYCNTIISGLIYVSAQGRLPITCIQTKYSDLAVV